MFKELPSINLQSSGIDFDQFRHDLTTFFMKHVYQGGCSLKHTPGQLSDHQSAEHHVINAKIFDPLRDMEYLSKIMQSDQPIVKESDYTEYNQNLIDHSPYVIECFHKLEEFTGIKFGRARMIALNTGVIPFHYDFGCVRYHIPIVTSPDAFFVLEDTVYNMPKVDHLYALNCSVPHTAINCGRIVRLHLLLVPITDDTHLDTKEKMIEHFEQSKQTAREFMANADSVCRLFNEPYFSKLDTLI